MRKTCAYHLESPISATSYLVIRPTTVYEDIKRYSLRNNLIDLLERFNSKLTGATANNNQHVTATKSSTCAMRKSLSVSSVAGPSPVWIWLRWVSGERGRGVRGAGVEPVV